MKYSRIALIFMVLGLLAFSYMGSQSIVEASITVDNPTVNATDDNNTFSETIESLITSLFSWIPKTLEMFVNILLTPFRAIGQVWENWAETISGWAGPIIAAFVIIVILLMVRIYTGFDDALDTFQDWISPGNE